MFKSDIITFFSIDYKFILINVDFEVVFERQYSILNCLYFCRSKQKRKFRYSYLLNPLKYFHLKENHFLVTSKQ